MKRLILACVVILGLVSMPLGAARSGGSDTDDIKDLINSFYDAYNDEDYDKCLTYATDYGEADEAKALLAMGRELAGEATVESIEDVEITDSTATARLIEVSSISSTSSPRSKPVTKTSAQPASAAPASQKPIFSSRSWSGVRPCSTRCSSFAMVPNCVLRPVPVMANTPRP